MTKTPDEQLLKEIKSCTEANRHIHANFLIAEWCEGNCEDDERNPGLNRERFTYFKDYFSRLEDHVRKVVIAPFWEVSYLMGMELDKEIARQFDDWTLAAFNSVR